MVPDSQIETEWNAVDRQWWIHEVSREKQLVEEKLFIGRRKRQRDAEQFGQGAAAYADVEFVPKKRNGQYKKGGRASYGNDPKGRN